MSVRAITHYVDDAGSKLYFAPLDTPTPGYTHKVLINGQRVGFLAAGFRPSLKTAEYYFAQHATSK